MCPKAEWKTTKQNHWKVETWKCQVSILKIRPNEIFIQSLTKGWPRHKNYKRFFFIDLLFGADSAFVCVSFWNALLEKLVFMRQRERGGSITTTTDKIKMLKIGLWRRSYFDQHKNVNSMHFPVAKRTETVDVDKIWNGCTSVHTNTNIRTTININYNNFNKFTHLALYRSMSAILSHARAQVAGT